MLLLCFPPSLCFAELEPRFLPRARTWLESYYALYFLLYSFIPKTYVYVYIYLDLSSLSQFMGTPICTSTFDLPSPSLFRGTPLHVAQNFTLNLFYHMPGSTRYYLLKLVSVQSCFSMPLGHHEKRHLTVRIASSIKSLTSWYLWY